jgi:chaperonin GroES
MSEFNLIATQGRLAVKKSEESNVTSGGIVLSQPVNQDVHTGVVVNVGSKNKDFNQDFEVGQTVAWQNYSGVEYEFENDTYVILNQSDIIAVVK